LILLIHCSHLAATSLNHTFKFGNGKGDCNTRYVPPLYLVSATLIIDPVD
jgi:hypothetical protein